MRRLRWRRDSPDHKPDRAGPTCLGRAVKTVVGKLSRRLQVRVLPGAPVKKYWFKIHTTTMVGVAQLVEPRVVIPVVVGSSPIVHPNSKINLM